MVGGGDASSGETRVDAGRCGRTSPVQGWLGYGWLVSFWGVMLLFQTVVVLGMHVPYVLFILMPVP